MNFCLARFASSVVAVEREQKSEDSDKVPFAQGLLDLVVGRDDVEDRQHAEVDGQVQESKEAVKEKVLPEHEVPHDDEQHVGHELGEPVEERQVDVQRVLLLAPLDDLRAEDLSQGHHVGRRQDVAERQRVEDHLRNAHQQELDRPAGDEAGHEGDESRVELGIGEARLEGPRLPHVADVAIVGSPPRGDGI